MFAYKWSNFGKNYSDPSDTRFIIILKSSQIITVPSTFNIGSIGVTTHGKQNITFN